VVELTLRLVASLAVVVGLLLLLQRFAARRFQGRTGATIQVVQRQALSRGSGVAVVTVAGRVLVLGTTEQSVTLLTELEPDELELELDLELDPDLDLEPDLELDQPEEPAPGQGAPTTPAYDTATAEEQRVRVVPAHRATLVPTKDGLLAGSVLSPETWRQALRVTRGTARRAS